MTDLALLLATAGASSVVGGLVGCGLMALRHHARIARLEAGWEARLVTYERRTAELVQEDLYNRYGGRVLQLSDELRAEIDALRGT